MQQQPQYVSADDTNISMITAAAPGRTCSTCRVYIVKDRTQFHKNKKRADGLCKACKPCARKAIQGHHEREKKKGHKATRRLQQYGKAGEADRHVPTKMPKWLYTGKGDVRKTRFHR